MWWLFRRVLALFAVSTTALLSSCFIGSAQPLPFSALFTYPDGSLCESPCLLGVRPGHTSHEDAIALLRSHPLTRHMRQTTDQSGVDYFGGESITISVAPDVSWITFHDYRPTFHVTPTPVIPRGTLSDVILLFGAPDSVQLSNGLYCYHSSSKLIAQYGRTTAQYVDPNAPLLELLISVHITADRDPIRRPWRGFTVASYYDVSP